MLETDRRGALGIAAVLPFFSPLSVLASGSASAAEASAAAWDLTEIYPDVAAWDAPRPRVLDPLPRVAA